MSIEKKKDVGYTIEDVQDKPSKNTFYVEVRFPEKERENARYSFKKGEDWREEIEYYENGEIKKSPRWKTHIEKQLKKQFEGEKQSIEEDDLSDVKDYIGDDLDV